MEYTYKGWKYADIPQNTKLYHPEIESILRKPKNDITLGEAFHILDLAKDVKHIDCETLILKEIARQRDKNLRKLLEDDNVNPHIINNALIFLVNACDFDSTFSVLLELLSQSEDFLVYNKIDTDDNNWSPIHSVLYYACTGYPLALQDFLLREGVTAKGKEIALRALGIIGAEDIRSGLYEDMHSSMLEVTKTVLDTYIADHEEERISNRRLLSRVVEVAAYSELSELYSEIEPLYGKGWIVESVCSKSEAYEGMIKGFVKPMPVIESSNDWLLPQSFNNGSELIKTGDNRLIVSVQSI